MTLFPRKEGFSPRKSPVFPRDSTFFRLLPIHFPMGEKNFREILEEKMAVSGAGSTERPRPRTPAGTLELSSFWPDAPRKRASSQVNIKQATRIYPPPPPKPEPPREPEKQDECLPFERLSAVEQVASRVLGLNEQAVLGRKDLKRTYRSLVQNLHPDHHSTSLSEAEKRRRTDKFRAIHEAYSVLEKAFRREAQVQNRRVSLRGS